MVEQYDITLTGGFRGAKSRTPRKENNSDSTWYYLGLVGQIGYVVALPIAGGAIVGSSFDRRFGMYPAGTVVGLSIGFLISIIGFVRVIQKVLEKQK